MDLPDLTKPEYDILRFLWKNEKLSVRELHNQIAPVSGWAYTTTKTMMDRMVQKGLLERESFHGIFLYKPLISRPRGLARMIQFFSERVLEIEPGVVVSMFSKSQALTAEEIKELEIILKSEKKKEP